MIELLEKDGSKWSLLFQEALTEFQRGDYRLCADIILSGSGGMGSLNIDIITDWKDQGASS